MWGRLRFGSSSCNYEDVYGTSSPVQGGGASCEGGNGSASGALATAASSWVGFLNAMSWKLPTEGLTIQEGAASRTLSTPEMVREV